MGTGVYRKGILGKEEVSQEDIDFWCDKCQFPIPGPAKCQTVAEIQLCWTQIEGGSAPQAGYWHILHECPFAHLTQKCRCNDFKTHRDAFASVGLPYQEPKSQQ